MSQFFREGTENDKRHSILAWILSLQIYFCVQKKDRHHLKNVKLLTYGIYATHTHSLFAN